MSDRLKACVEPTGLVSSGRMMRCRWARVRSILSRHQSNGICEERVMTGQTSQSLPISAYNPPMVSGLIVKCSASKRR